MLHSGKLPHLWKCYRDILYLALAQMMKECSRWVRLPSAQSVGSLEEGGNLTYFLSGPDSPL